MDVKMMDNVIKSLASGATYSVADKFLFNKENGSFDWKRAGYQVLSSYGSCYLTPMLKDLLPKGAQIDSMYLKPLVTGTLFSLLVKFVDKSEQSSKELFITFAKSAGSDLVASYGYDKLVSPYIHNYGQSSEIRPSINVGAVKYR